MSFLKVSEFHFEFLTEIERTKERILIEFVAHLLAYKYKRKRTVP